MHEIPKVNFFFPRSFLEKIPKIHHMSRDDAPFDRLLFYPLPSGEIPPGTKAVPTWTLSQVSPRGRCVQFWMENRIDRKTGDCFGLKSSQVFPLCRFKLSSWTTSSFLFTFLWTLRPQGSTVFVNTCIDCAGTTEEDLLEEHEEHHEDQTEVVEKYFHVYQIDISRAHCPLLSFTVHHSLHVKN